MLRSSLFRNLLSQKFLSRNFLSRRFTIFLLLVLSASPVHAQQTSQPAIQGAKAEAVVAPAESLVADGIPPIPSALAEDVARYSEFRSAAFLGWHPTLRQMLISTRFADTSQLHFVKFPGGARSQLTFYKDSVREAAFSPVNGDSLVFSKDVGGGEFYQLYHYDLAAARVTLLTDGKSRNLMGPWSYSGKWLAYGSTRRTGDDVDLYIIDPANPVTDKMLAQLSGGGWTPLDWSPGDRNILLQEEISANESYLWIVDAASGEKTLLTPKGGKEKIYYGKSQFSKDGKGVFTVTDRESEFQRLSYIDLTSKAHVYLTSDIPWDVEEFDLSPDGKTIAFISNEDGFSSLHLLDTATRKVSLLPVLPRGEIFGLAWHKHGREVAFTLDSARSNDDAFSVDVSSGKLERWTTSETGGLNAGNFSEPELIHWKSFDGKMISGFLYRPPPRFTGKRPVMIEIHGGPEGQSRPGFLGRTNYYLNELGAAVIYPNVRGSTGYGKTFLALDNGFLREGSYKDIGALLDWIAAQPGLDSGRVLVAGGSYGGHMTLAVSTLYSDRIRCSVDVVGMSNLVTFLEHTSGYRRDLRRVEYGDERDPKMREFLERIAPMNNLEKIRKPMFVVAGQNDPRVPLSESEQIVAALKHNGTPVWFLIGKDEGHGFSKKKNQDFQFYATVMFLRQFLFP